MALFSYSSCRKALYILLVASLALLPVPVYAAETADMTIVFNPTGTHIDDAGNLKVRLDFYPAEGCKSYKSQTVINEKGETVINPSLCHFITVKPNILRTDLDSYVKAMFPGSVLATIDDAVIQDNSAHLLSPYMRTKAATAEAYKLDLKYTNVELVKNVVNLRLTGYSLGTATTTIEQITPESIDVGCAAVTGSALTAGRTRFDSTNPANADGTIDTVEVFFATAGTATNRVGTFSGSGTDYNDRDYENVGNIAGGSKTTFTGLTITVVSGDLFGIYYTLGTLCYTAAGGTGYAYIGDGFNTGSLSYTATASRSLSLYATGTESGGAPFIPKMWWW